MKLSQQDYWGSPEWVRSFSRRPRVEGAFGLLKGARTGGLRRGWTHQVGLVKTSILLAIAVAAKNLSRLIAWSRQTAYERDPIAQMDVAGHGFVEVDEHGAIVGDLPPPTPTAA